KAMWQVNEFIQPEHDENDDKAYDLKELKIATELTMSDLNAHGHTPFQFKFTKIFTNFPEGGEQWQAVRGNAFQSKREGRKSGDKEIGIQQDTSAPPGDARRSTCQELE
ncbi:MAG: hypothetical protein V2A56_07545, partial [bacterium]